MFLINEFRQTSFGTDQKEEVKNRPISVNQLNIILTMNSNVNVNVKVPQVNPDEDEEIEFM